MQKVLAIFYEQSDVDEEILLGYLGNEHEIGVEEGRRLIGVLMRDGTILLEDGFYKMAGGF